MVWSKHHIVHFSASLVPGTRFMLKMYNVYWDHSGFFSIRQKSLNQGSPYQNSVEVPHLHVQPLVLTAGQTKAHGEEHQGQSGHPCKHKAHRPQIKPEPTQQRGIFQIHPAWGCINVNEPFTAERLGTYLGKKPLTFSDDSHQWSTGVWQCGSPVLTRTGEKGAPDPHGSNYRREKDRLQDVQAKPHTSWAGLS